MNYILAKNCYKWAYQCVHTWLADRVRPPQYHARCPDQSDRRPTWKGPLRRSTPPSSSN